MKGVKAADLQKQIEGGHGLIFLWAILRRQWAMGTEVMGHGHLVKKRHIPYLTDPDPHPAFIRSPKTDLKRKFPLSEIWILESREFAFQFANWRNVLASKEDLHIKGGRKRLVNAVWGYSLSSLPKLRHCQLLSG